MSKRSILGLALLPIVCLNAGCATPTSTVCSNADGALANAAFVIVDSPRSGERVRSGFQVSGCSRTFEGDVQWRLLARDGSTLARGFTNGGAVDGPEAFAPITVTYDITERQIGHLEIYEEDVSDGEGFPPGRNVIPLVLQP